MGEGVESGRGPLNENVYNNGPICCVLRLFLGGGGGGVRECVAVLPKNNQCFCFCLYCKRILEYLKAESETH